MKIKQLREKREALLNDLEVMVSGLEKNGEIRSLTADEKTAFDSKKVEIEAIDDTISRIEETRARDLGKVDELTEKRSKQEIEKRAVESFFRGIDLAREERTILASTSSNQALMPLEISKTIMQKLEEIVPVLDHARRFSAKGTLRLLKEENYGSGAINPENTNFPDEDVAFASVELRAFKVSASVQATFEMLQNTEVDLSNYLLDVITRRLAKEMNKFFMVGTGTNQPEGLINAKQIQEIGSEITIQDLILLQTALNPAMLDKACWMVNRPTFQSIAKLLDGTGRPYLTSNVIGEKIQYSILGLPVVVDCNLPNIESGAKPIILANIGEAYSINILTDITIKHMTEIGFSKGYESFAGYVLCDGRIVNEEAIIIGQVAAARKK